jgi:hypothetical protein
VNTLLGRVFAERHRSGRRDLEAVEAALRTGMHHAGAVALTELLQFAPPSADQRSVACGCSHEAHYVELRSKPVLSAVGEVRVSRPYYLCAHCHTGQFPADVELDIENTWLSPAVRRMQALVGQEAAFDLGREQIKMLAGLEVTTKAVERTAEAIGGDIAKREQQEIQRAVQLDLPIVVGQPIPILYVQMDGTGVPVVKKETEGRKGKPEGQPAHTREAKLGCVFTQTGWDEEGYPIRDPDSTTFTGAIETAEEFGKRLYLEAWKRGWSRAEKKVVMGDGAEWIWNLAEVHFPGAVQIVDLYHANTYGSWRANYFRMTKSARKPGSRLIKSGYWTKEKSKNWWSRSAPFSPPIPQLPRRFAPKPTTSTGMPSGCATPNSDANTYSSAPE